MLQRIMSATPAEVDQAGNSGPFKLFDSLGRFSANNLYLYNDPACDLKAIIAIHNSQRGPSLGGCRLASYRCEYEAIQDALGLAKGMSYKAAIHQLPFGGGKAVLIKPGKPIQDRQRYFESFGRFVESLGGRYISAVDSGTSVTDMDYAAKSTQFITSTSNAIKGTGDPSPHTAEGVLIGMMAGLQKIRRSSDLTGLKVAIQGVGQVGYLLAKALHLRGAELYVSDKAVDKTERCRQQFGAIVVSPEDIHRVECDVFCPCALSGALTRKVVKELKCRLVAGAANLQLASPEAGLSMHKKGIIYLPDYVVNVGGLMHVGLKYQAVSDQQVQQRVQSIGSTVTRLLKRSTACGQPVHEIADMMAEEAIEAGTKKEAR